ncbi:VCBS repeat-containing protein [uncultured Jannaschia sp.]|uniref:FG-GAP repeat domain-containing protein n=1 Tax=uncultured Jannaschia sp. TaxID=293347 RepID=UPI0026391BCB|nr:VCBS repeat-containing protein [uncultured Jannaschia sp.]
MAAGAACPLSRLAVRCARAARRAIAPVAMALAALGALPAWACLPDAMADALPGSQTLSLTGASAAWYADPTDIYGHGIMGGVEDALTLAAVIQPDTATCHIRRVAAGDGHVFEDIAPRLHDVDGDGRAEVMAVRSSLTDGAQLVIYAARGDGLELLAATPFIGRRNRWLAPAGIGDLDGDGAVELAYVDRPHLAKRLRIWRYADGALREVAALDGVTNHRIGGETIEGGLIRCGEGPILILASADWSRRLAVAVHGGTFETRDLGPWRDGTPLTCAP